jgi:hypothetical protein
MLPHLVSTIRPLEMIHQPFASALLRVPFHRFEQCFRRELLVVAQDFLQLISCFRTGDQVNVVGHDAPREELKTFLALAMAQTLYDDVLIVGPCQYIHPADRGIGQVVQVRLVVDLVVAAHQAEVRDGRSQIGGSIPAQVNYEGTTDRRSAGAGFVERRGNEVMDWNMTSLINVEKRENGRGDALEHEARNDLRETPQDDERPPRPNCPSSSLSLQQLL